MKNTKLLSEYIKNTYHKNDKVGIPVSKIIISHYDNNTLNVNYEVYDANTKVSYSDNCNVNVWDLIDFLYYRILKLKKLMKVVDSKLLKHYII